jgi:hypothetical protein
MTRTPDGHVPNDKVQGIPKVRGVTADEQALIQHLATRFIWLSPPPNIYSLLVDCPVTERPEQHDTNYRSNHKTDDDTLTKD